MLSNGVSRSLFRSLLRWNRRPEVVASKFGIDTSLLKIDKLIPKDFTVIGNEHVQGTIFHCFRNHPPTEENLDLCFSVLRDLNELSSQLTERIQLRAKYSSEEYNSRVVFRVGEVVKYKKLKFRGVVIGWEIDPETKRQRIEVLFDSIDQNEHNDARHFIPQYIEHNHFSLLEDRAQTRINHPMLKNYFDGYNNKLNRYIPKEELLFIYPKDFDPLEAEVAQSNANPVDQSLFFQSNANLDGSSSSSAATTGPTTDTTNLAGTAKTSTAAASTTTETSNLSAEVSSAAEHYQKLQEKLAHSSDTIHHSVIEIGNKIQTIVQNYISPADYVKITTELQNGELLQAENKGSKSTDRNIILRQVLDELISTARLCTEANATIFENDKGQLDRVVFENKDSDQRTGVNNLIQKRRRGGIFREADDDLLSIASIYGILGTEQPVPGVENSDFPAKNLEKAIERGDLLNLFMQKSYSSLSALHKLFNVVDQLLQLRYQQKGVAYFEGLKVASSVNTGTYKDFQTSGDNTNNAYTTVKEVDFYATKHAANTELESVHKSLEIMNYESSQPPVRFEVGQVVRHKLYNYRAIVSGYDIKPLLNVAAWEAVQGLPQGQEQPFYKVIPDERDVQSMLGAGSKRSHLYAAQDNLELVTDPSQMIVSHKYMRSYFLGFDIESQRYVPKHKLSYCFPNLHTSAATAATADTTGVNNTIINNAIATARAEESYETIDKILLESYAVLRNAFSTARETYSLSAKAAAASTATAGDDSKNRDVFSPAVLNVDDLLLHLKHATTKEDAQVVESVLWLVWLTHQNCDVNKAMRLGVSHSKRGSITPAFDAFKLASTLDPTFAEPHNKLAALYHTQGDYENCLKHAKIALTLFPQHFGALSGMGLANEKLGKNSQAIAIIRHALDIHPWAANLPTILLSHERRYDAREKYIPSRKRGTNIPVRDSASDVTSVEEVSNSGVQSTDVITPDTSDLHPDTLATQKAANRRKTTKSVGNKDKKKEEETVVIVLFPEDGDDDDDDDDDDNDDDNERKKK